MNSAKPLSQNDPMDLIMQQAPIGILRVGLEGGILGANPAFCTLTGYTDRELRHRDNREISHPEDFAVELRLIQLLVKQGCGQPVMQKRFLCRNGSPVWTETRLSLVGDPDESSSYLLMFVTDLSDRKQAEQEIQRHREREALLNHISAQMRVTFDIQAVLQTAVERLRHALGVDRVIAYQFHSDQSGTCLAEAVNPLYPSMLGQQFPAECMPPPYLEAYRLGRVWAMADVHRAELATCHYEMLEQVYVRSMMAIAIVSMDEALEPQKRTLWGLLVVHQCHFPRQWSLDEQQLIQAVANQIATALEQTKLLHELQRYTLELEDRVSQRTQSLERALQFEQLIRSLTETLRNDLDEDQMLKAAVEGLGRALNADGCLYSIFEPQSERLKVGYEFFRNGIKLRQSLVGKSFSLTQCSEACRQHLLYRRTYVTHVPIQPSSSLWVNNPGYTTLTDSLLQHFTIAEPTQPLLVSKLMSPIVDEQGLMGILTVLQLQPRQFAPDEINLVEQVASQCAIALRQAHLYRQEHEQRLSASYFRSFLEASIDIFVEYDLQLRYVSINAVGCAFLGQSKAEIIGKTDRDLLGEAADPIESLIQQVIDTGEKVFVNYEVCMPQGARVFETVYAPITNPGGAVQRVIGVCRDVTELRQQWQLLESQNHQLAETTRLKEEFVATTSHELRTPLTAILGFSNVLLQEFFGELNSKQKDYIERIHGSGQHLLELINDILDLSRLEADRLELELETIFVPDICEGVIGLVQERALNQGLQLELDLDPSIEWIVADPRRLKQMLLNLLTNAVKFTQAGSVGLKVYRQTYPDTCSWMNTQVTDACQVRSISSGVEMIHFLVWDTGIGINEMDQRLLFAPFSQIDSSLARKHEGTGLGLVITRKLAELHGGMIQMESNADRGSCFTISLPLRLSAQ